MVGSRGKLLTTRNHNASIGDHSEDGFVSAQFTLLMVLGVMILVMFVNIIMIENIRATTLSSLRDAARDGARVVDLRRAYETPDAADDLSATKECVDSMKKAMDDMFAISDAPVTCEILHDTTDGRDRFVMKATVAQQQGIYFLPLLKDISAISDRISNLSATYAPTEAARNDE